MKTQAIGKTICRLAVVAKDFSTYYIPGVTTIVDKQVNQIAEIGDEYHILDFDGNLISKVHKSAPCVVDYTDVFEVDEEFLKDDETTQALVNFGNYLLKRYGVHVVSNDGENKPLYQRVVTDADLANWQHELLSNIKQD